jgi:hypothetical protein
VTIFKEAEVVKSKRIIILLYKKSYIVLTQLYTEAQLVKELFKSKFNIISEIKCFSDKEYITFINRYKINNIYVARGNKIIDIKIKKNKEIKQYVRDLYSVVFMLKYKDVFYVLNVPKFGLFSVGNQKKEDIINILEGLNLDYD